MGPSGGEKLECGACKSDSLATASCCKVINIAGVLRTLSCYECIRRIIYYHCLNTVEASSASPALMSLVMSASLLNI